MSQNPLYLEMSYMDPWIWLYIWIKGSSEEGVDPELHELPFCFRLWEILDSHPDAYIDWDSDISDEDPQDIWLDINHIDLDPYNGYNMEVRPNGETVPEFTPKENL